MNTKLDRPREAFPFTGNTKGTWYRQEKRGLVPPFLKIADRCVAIPHAELEALNAARIAGKTDDEIRSLVADLIAKRKEVTP